MTQAQQPQGYYLTTAEITYRRPNFSNFLQNYILQDHDIASQFPFLRRFLHLQETNLDRQLHSVRVAPTELIRSSKFRIGDSGMCLHQTGLLGDPVRAW